jgi:aminoglycoside phosphotransferase family enzyme
MTLKITDLISDDYDAHDLALLLFDRIRFEDENDYGYSLYDLSDQQLDALADVLESHSSREKSRYTIESNGTSVTVAVGIDSEKLVLLPTDIE